MPRELVFARSKYIGADLAINSRWPRSEAETLIVRSPNDCQAAAGTPTTSRKGFLLGATRSRGWPTAQNNCATSTCPNYVALGDFGAMEDPDRRGFIEPTLAGLGSSSDETVPAGERLAPTSA